MSVELKDFRTPQAVYLIILYQIYTIITTCFSKESVLNNILSCVQDNIQLRYL